MPPSEQEAQDVRKKRTVLLLAGGAVSLVLPLLGIVYIRMNEAKTARPPDGSVMFDRRENGSARVNVSQTVAIPTPAGGSGASSLPVAGGTTMAPAAGGGSSLDFVKGGASNAYFQDKAALAASTQTAPAAAAPAAPPEPEPAPKAVAQKGGKKAFNAPKLSGTKSFSTFKGGSPKPSGGQGMAGVADPKAGKGGGDMAEMLKGVPGGADNPEVQKYLKSQGK